MEHKGRYGSPRITDELIDRGIAGSENRVCARMKTLNLRAKAKRKFKMTTDSNHNKPIAPNCYLPLYHPKKIKGQAYCITVFGFSSVRVLFQSIVKYSKVMQYAWPLYCLYG